MRKSRDVPPKVVDRPLYTIARDEVLRKISIPEYMKNHIDPDIDLTYRDSCLCPFHEENSPSFRYNREGNYWKCFGKCKDGGTVIELHKARFGFENHFDALEDMKKKFGKMYGLTFKPFMFDATDTAKTVNDILREKKKMSVNDFMGDNVKETLASLITKIEFKLSILKNKDKHLYAEACIEFDSLYSSMSLTEETAKQILGKIEKVLK